jgi:Flp pilus assembly protein TadG
MNMDLPAKRPCDSEAAGTVRDKNRRRSNGQSIVEMTLLLPLVLATLYIPADFGVAFFTAHLVQNATREAARIGASMNPFVAETVENEATKRLPAWKFVASSVSATLNGSSTSTCMRRVVVSVSGSYDFFWYRLLNLFVPDAVVETSLPITRNTAMRYDSQALTNTGSCS